MIVERFKNADPLPVYRHLRDAGRGLPEGLRYVDSWVEPNFDRCFQVMECDDAALLQEWVLHWAGPRGLRDHPGGALGRDAGGRRAAALRHWISGAPQRRPPRPARARSSSGASSTSPCRRSSARWISQSASHGFLGSSGPWTYVPSTEPERAPS